MHTESPETGSRLEENQTAEFVAVKVLHTEEILFCRKEENFPWSKGTRLIVPTKFGPDLAEVLGDTEHCHGCPAGSTDPEEQRLVTPVELSTLEDDALFQSNLTRSDEAFRITQDLIEQHNLNMKLIRVHFVLRESRIVFFFTSEKRVDFRALVRDLVSHFRARIELRQIGARDEARMTGGRGVCGRALCCSSIGDNLEPVSIKMAKIQKLSLNSQKISGPCGRLLCCLAFEYQTYQREQEGLPREGSWISDGEERLRISEVNVLNRKICAYSQEGVRREYQADRLGYSSAKSAWILKG